jgi:hypothetical protein
MGCFTIGAISNFEYTPTTDVQGHLFGKMFILFQAKKHPELIPAYFKDYFGSVGMAVTFTLSDHEFTKWLFSISYKGG